ncbi:unnamed protein product [Eruca vesicaria subsp. sativa]|uniref:PPIase cyclophilin-type domain-containing protein n=1 Tax=Eruca vesicaria subsp. sativa TaxID=29727 RepID=A0ABC8JXM9_ERUVS|nr:unnamed protein product [Eruca vesicaria subsp. sativa]
MMITKTQCPKSLEITRLNLLLSTTIATVSLSPQIPSPDVTIADRVFLDFSLCPTYFRSDPSPHSPPPHLAPPTPLLSTASFSDYMAVMFPSLSPLSNSCALPLLPLTKTLPSKKSSPARTTARHDGGWSSPEEFASNINSKSFLIPHARPGLVSLCLSENNDDDETRLDPEYRNVEFLITTGHGPCPQLDGGNIVFGTVLEGLDVVTSIAAVPTFKPSEKIRQFNDFAEFLGDERAQNARSLWNRPLKTVFISDW